MAISLEDFVTLESIYYGRKSSFLPLLKRLGVEVKCPCCGELDFAHKNKEAFLSNDWRVMRTTCRAYYTVQYKCFGGESGIDSPEELWDGKA